MRSSKKKAKRAIPKISYNVNSIDEYLAYTKTDKTQGVVFEFTLNAIRNGVADGSDTTDLFCLPGKDANSVYSIDRKHWKTVLNKAIKFYSKNDQFEKCIDCQQLIDALQ